MTLSELNGADRATFVGAIGWVFEHSPWVAERAWVRRPFATVDDLSAAMADVVSAASKDEQLALLRAHPDLGARARMTSASTGEQAGAGLDRLSTSDFEKLIALNARYRERFGFPFVLAVKGATAPQIIRALEERVARIPDVEWAEALAQVARIATNRLGDFLERS